MKNPAPTPNIQTSQSQSLQFSSLQSYHSSMSMKYGGLIKPPFLRVLRNDMIQLSTYIFTQVPTFQLLHTIVSVFRILQFLGPSIFAPYDSIWTPGTSARRTVSTISVIFHLILPEYRSSSGRIYLYVYVAVMVAFSIVFLSSCQYYKNNSHLPSYISNFLVYFYTVCGHLLTPIALEFAAEDLGRISFEKNASDFVLRLVIVIIVLLLSVVLIRLNITIISQSLTFRLSSLMSTLTMPQNFFDIATNVAGFITGFGSQATIKWQIGIASVTFFIYAISSLIPFYFGGFVDNWVSSTVYSTSIASALTCIGAVVYLSIQKNAGISAIILIVAAHILVWFTARFAFQSVLSRHLLLCDEIMNDIESFSKIKRATTFLNVAIHGFRFAHPICINWTLFRLGVEKFRNNGNVWLLFAKFVAIYPEEMQTLNWIYKSVIEKRVKGEAARTIKQQSIVLARSRETNLCADLKDKLEMIQQKIHKTMHKLSRIWDVAIQGNISEVETTTKAFIDERKENDVAFERLFRQFPNNRFVYRAYGHFLSDLSADHIRACEMFDKMRMLQTGHQISKDACHELGCRAFPLIPERISREAAPILDMQSDLSQSMPTDDQSEEAAVKLNDESQTLYREMIDSVKIPGTRSTIVTRIFLLLILVLAPYIAFLVYMSYFVSDKETPVEFANYIQCLVVLNAQASAFSNRFVFQTLGIAAATESDGTLNVFNGSWSTSEQLSQVLINISLGLQKIETFYSYQTSLSQFDQVKSQLFDNSFEYTHYTSLTNSSSSMTSITSSMTEYVVQGSTILNTSVPITQNATKSSAVLDPLANSLNLSTTLSSAYQYLYEFVLAKRTSEEQYILGIFIANICIQVIVYSMVYVREYKVLNSTKAEAYRCLTVLPKNTISLLSENLRMFKKKTSDSTSSNTSDQETNKREESIIKLLSTGTQSSFHISDLQIIIVGTLLSIAMNCLGGYFLYAAFNDVETSMVSSITTFNSTFCSYSSTIQSIFFLSALAEGFQNFSLDNQYLVSTQRASEYWSNIKQDLSSYRNTTQSCDNTSTLREVYDCYYIDYVFESIGMFLQEAYASFKDQSVALSAGNELFGRSYDVMLSPLYNEMFDPMFETSYSGVASDMQSVTNTVIPKIIGLIIGSLLVEVVIILEVTFIDSHIRDVLRIILHCSPSVIRQSPKIMAVLSGDFRPPRADFTSRSKDYFDSVYNSLIDAVLYTDPGSNIISCNEACERFFGISKEQLSGQSLGSFFQSSLFSGNVSALLTNSSCNNERIIYKRPDGSEMILSVSTTSFDHKVILTAVDITSMVRYQQLIEEEKARSDRLLASIIPATLVSRVQAGEKQISFSVQSASIVFCDVVEFTPWCGSLPASKVMRTLNSLFGRLDALLVKYPTITRIKGIGDCYMAAGGIFSEINQPAEHAKEAVSFGLDVIDSLNALNTELGENLRIRVGINTGGPIVAGVLGISKPTFEIFGPAINLAQQMEHNGLPMQVHISRSVYELVYGEAFKIKERGTIEVKGGKVLTYLVSRNDAK